MSNEVIDAEFSIADGALSVSNDVGGSVAVMRIENDTISALATQKPRSIKAIREELAEVLREFPAIAEVAIYAKPVGKVILGVCDECGAESEQVYKFLKPGEKAWYKCDKCNSSKITTKGKPYQKIARGLSVRSAELLLQTWGYARVVCEILPYNSTTVKLQSRWTDLQKGVLVTMESLVSKGYTSKSGSFVLHPQDRFENTILKGAQSKLIREVIVRSISPALREWWWAQCDALQGQMMNDKKVEEVVSAFAKFGIDSRTVERIIGRPSRAGWTMDDRKNLLGIHAALKSGEMTKAKLLEDLDAEDQQEATQQQQTAPQSNPLADALTSGQGTTGTRESITKPKTEEPHDGGPTNADVDGTVDHTETPKVDPVPMIIGSINKKKTAEDVEAIVADEQQAGVHSPEAFAKIVAAAEARKAALASKGGAK